MSAVIIVGAEDEGNGVGRLMDQSGCYIYCHDGYARQAKSMLAHGDKVRASLDHNGKVWSVFAA